MDKEQKKLLLVAISVGVFLLVTITAAIIILTPKVNTEEPPPPPVARIQPVENTPVLPVADNPQITNNNPNGENTEPAPVVTIETPSLNGPAIPPPDITPSSTPIPAAVAPARPAANPAPASQPAASRPAAAARPAPARTTNDYWIQTGAYSAIVRAEDAKELLASKGLTSIIESRVIDGRNLYRVRLGPYTSESEAGYWLKLVKEIDGFNDSQVRQTVRQ